ncbi:MAG: helix-turn-helix domain-containing protein [Lactobacillus sp.]|jgi:putative transcriptional regulator|nr:helix-turn-helix domain-containing protein [Lactobacillus sp.]
MAKTTLEKSAEQIEAFLHGDKGQVHVETVNIPDPPAYTAAHIQAIRKQINVTQRVLATILAVSPRTVESWEAGRTKPSGSSRRLLETIDKDPKIIALWRNDQQ